MATQQQRRASTAALTFPILSFKELADLLHNALGIHMTQQDAASPSPQTVAKVYNALLDLVTGVPREEVAEVIQNALEGVENRELYREGLTQLTLMREMEEVCRASLFPEFRMEDLVAPTGQRFQKILSAILNYGRFREDVFQRHAEQTEGLAKMEKELQTLKELEENLQESIRTVSERLAREAPERQRLMLDKDREESALKSLNAEKTSLEKACNEDKKRAADLKAKCDSLAFDINKLENEISEIKAQIISSPEKIQAGLAQLKKRLEQGREDLENAKEEERLQLTKKDDIRKATVALEDCMKTLENTEERLNEASKEEEKTRARKIAIENHSIRVRELKQREQEAQQECKLAEERNNRLAAQRQQKLQLAREDLNQLMRERQNRERDLNEENRRASRLRDEAAKIRAQIQKARIEHEKSMALRQSLFGDVRAVFDAYLEGVNEGVAAVNEACSLTSVRN